jgi:dienelactone hydrolase
MPILPPPSPPSDTDHRHARWRPQSALHRFPDGNYKLRITNDEVDGAPIHNSSFVIRNSVDSAASHALDPRNVLIVGVCSAGKSTLARALKEKGYKARTCAQEHSYVAYLWQLSKPDVLIYLDASLPTIRRRRRVRWPQSLLDEEHRRLSHARKHCDLYVHTDGLTPEDVASRVVTFLRNQKSEIRNQELENGGQAAEDAYGVAQETDSN